MINWLKNNILTAILIAIIMGLLVWLSSYWFSSKPNPGNVIIETEYKDSNNVYHNINYDKDFKELKEKNKELYDSLKKYKNEINHIIQFYYQKEYDTGVVETPAPKPQDEEIKEYTYSSQPNDTLKYDLSIGSTREPNWYKLHVGVSDKFTIVNKNAEGVNHTTIETGGNNGDISNVTVWNKKEKTPIYKRFAVGPSVSAGYDPINKKWGVLVGVSVTFDITKRK